MATAALPSPVRDHALDLMARRLGRTVSLEDRLVDFGGAVAVSLMIDMEVAFHILIDVDEVLPNGTVGVLLELTELRAKTLRPLEPCRLIDLAAERRRRSLAEAEPRTACAPPQAEPQPEPQPQPITVEQVTRGHRIAGMFGWAAVAAGGLGAMLFWLAEQGWIAAANVTP